MKNKKFKLAVIVLTAYTILLIYMMFFNGRRTQEIYLYNFTPFKSISNFLKRAIIKNIMIDIIGNIGVFIPFGILLAIIFNGKFIKSIIIFDVGIITLEIAQLVTRRGVCDIDDFILNTLGFLIGFAIIKIFWKLRGVITWKKVVRERRQ